VLDESDLGRRTAVTTASVAVEVPNGGEYFSARGALAAVGRFAVLGHEAELGRLGHRIFVHVSDGHRYDRQRAPRAARLREDGFALTFVHRATLLVELLLSAFSSSLSLRLAASRAAFCSAYSS
jgi:hypothetical protein